MTRNQSSGDRLIHVAAGLALLTTAFVGPQTLWGLLGLIPILTGLTGVDPLYTMLSVSTRRGAPSAVVGRGGVR